MLAETAYTFVRVFEFTWALNFHWLLRSFLRAALAISILRDEEGRRKCSHFYLCFANFRAACFGD